MARITVLFVEDDSLIRPVLSDILPEGEFDTLVAADSEEALDIIEHRHVDVLVTDIVMPTVDGVALAREAMRLQAEIGVVLMTGYYTRAREAEKIAPVLYKPVRELELEDAVRKVYSSLRH